MTATAPGKITYTSASGDLDAFHQQFDAALAAVRAAAGKRHPFYIAGRAVDTGAEPLVIRKHIMDCPLCQEEIRLLAAVDVVPIETGLGRLRQ